MSTTETEEKKVDIERSPSTDRIMTVSGDQPGIVRTVQAEAPSSVHSDTVVKHSSTNTGAILAMVVGLVVLLGGIGLIATQLPMIPSPYGLYAIIGFGVLLLIVGLGIMSSRK